MYDFLFDQEEVTRRYVQEEIQIGIQQGIQQGAYNTELETAKRMLKKGGFSFGDIAEISGLSIEEVEKLKNEMHM